MSVTFGNTSAAAAAQITVRLTSNENSSVVVEATQQPYMIAICPRQFVQVLSSCVSRISDVQT